MHRQSNTSVNELKTLDTVELRGVAELVGIKKFKSLPRDELIDALKNKLNERFVPKGTTLGKPGKEGTAHVVWDRQDQVERVKKQFRPRKSVNTLQKEATLQNAAAEAGISPKVYHTDSEQKFIVMEKMNITLIEKMKRQGNSLTPTQQREILQLFEKLDNIGIFHGDPNPLNFMYYPYDHQDPSKRNRLGIIDYGFAKRIEGARELKVYNGHPNKTLMTIGLLVYLKKRNINTSAFGVLMDTIPPQAKEQFDL